MGKGKGIERTTFRQSDPEVETVVGTEEVERKFEQSKKIRLTFRFNRSFELKIGRQITRFEGRESHSFPSSILEHKDFTSAIQKKFVIQEEK